MSRSASSAVENRLRASEAPSGDTLVYSYLVLTPVLWACGLLAPAGALVVAWLAITRWSKSKEASLLVLPWLFLAAMQSFAAVVAWSYEGGGLVELPRHLLSMTVLGWLFLGLAVAAGYSHALTSPRLVRGVAVLGLYILILGTAALALYRAGLAGLDVKTPIGYLLPDTPGVAFYFTMQFFVTEDSFGGVAPRLILFFPWATMLSMGGLMILFISSQDEHPFWRLVGAAGGIMAVVFSFSRIGWLMVVACSCLYMWLQLDTVGRWTAIAAAWLTGTVLLFTGFDPFVSGSSALQAISDARSGSSLGRSMIYERSWEGFQRSPMFGQGWIGDSVIPTEYLPVGSHSSVYGLLYTGGLVSFVFLVLALALTGLLTARNALRGCPCSKVALVLVFALIGFSPVESLFSFSLPCMFGFMWIGGAARAANDAAQNRRSSFQ